MNCYRHPKVETAVSCGRCDKPICPKCMVAGPAGMRCPDCASLRQSPLYKVHPGRLVLAGLAGIVVGTVGAFALSMISFLIFITFFAGPIYGGIVAEVVLRVTGRKRGRNVEIVGVGSILIGAALVFGPQFLHSTDSFPGIVRGLVFPLIGIALAISTCYGRLKYL